MINEQLINKIKNKDKEAFKQLFDMYKERVYRISYRVLKEKSASEDVLQEVFIQIYLKIKDLKHIGAFEVWLYRVTMNCCKKFINKENRLKEISVNDGYDGYMDIEDDEINTPENIIMQQEFCKEVTLAINELPAYQRMSLLLFYYNEMTVKEISNIMNCPEGTVKSRLFHGKKYLKNKIYKII